MFEILEHLPYTQNKFCVGNVGQYICEVDDIGIHLRITLIGIILTHCVPMEFPIKFDTVKSGWFIVYFEGSQVIISKNSIFLSLKIDCVLANSADPDEMSNQ